MFMNRFGHDTVVASTQSKKSSSLSRSTRVHLYTRNDITEIDASGHAHDPIQGQQVCRRRHTRTKQ